MSPSARVRHEALRHALAKTKASAPVLLIGAHKEAGDAFVRKMHDASFGWHRTTLLRYADACAARVLAARSVVLASRAVLFAVAVRVVHQALAEGRLGRFSRIADRPGCGRAAFATLEELRLRIAAEWQPADLEATRRLIDAGHLSLEGLITHRAAAVDAGAAYTTAFTDPTCLKMILDWSASA
mgnify:CR=1 FL=1